MPEEGPKTWKELSDFAAVIKEKTGVYGFYMQEPADFWAQQGIIESNGASMIQKDQYKVKATFASKEGIEAMSLVANMIADGNTIHVSWYEGCESFIDGNCAMLYTTIVRRASIQDRAKFDVATVKSPLWEGKDGRF